MMDSMEPAIAIVGMSCHLPGDVYTPQQLLEFCLKARPAYSEIPKERWDARGWYHPNQRKPGYNRSRGGGFLQHDVGRFDAPFFGITEKEAVGLDPQHRQLLECAYEAIEDAGTPLNQLAGQAVGVFAAIAGSDWERRVIRDPLTVPEYSALGMAANMFANRLSYYFNLCGPSISVDTACSSTLSALHLAVRSLLAGDCRSAVVGGSVLHLDPNTFALMSNVGILGPKGRCFAYDDRAEGFGRGEGAVCLILKPLAAAIADGDSVRAVIRATSLNHSGKTRGITMPSDIAQEKLIRAAYTSANLNVLDTDFVEGHGTGTAVGDPLEANAIRESFTPQLRTNGPLYLGSVKSQFGHLEGTSGLVSVVKCVLMLENKILLPNADFQHANNNIMLHEWNMKVLSEAMPWLSDKPRRASVNNFGFGGSNNHIILEEAPSVSSSNRHHTNGRIGIRTNGHANGHTNGHSSNSVDGQDSGVQFGIKDNVSQLPIPQQGVARIFPLSARNEEALARRAKDMLAYIENTHTDDEEQFFIDFSFTLSSRREHFPYRFACSAVDIAELKRKVDDKAFNGRGSREPVIAYVFTGQGAQWHGMGKELLVYDIFASKIDAAEKYLTEFGANWSLKDELWKDSDQTRLSEAEVAQPAVTAIQIALVALLSSFGFHPKALVGHSSGEIAAAYAAGQLDLRCALAVAYHRGKVASRVKVLAPEARGSMLAVGASPAVVDGILEDVEDGEAIIACYNSPSSVTVSGDEAAIDQVKKAADQLNLFTRKLRVDVAYHSHHMQSVAGEYMEAISNFTEQQPHQKNQLHGLQDRPKFYSSVTGRQMDVARLDANYWTTNLTSPVQFASAVEALLQNSIDGDDSDHQPDMLIEIGPASALKGPVQEIINASGRQPSSRPASYASALERNKSAQSSILDLVAAAFVKGFGPAFSEVILPNSHGTGKPLHDLPRYPWNHDKRYWIRTKFTEASEANDFEWNVVLGRKILYSPEPGDKYRNVFTLDDVPYLRDHKVYEDVIFPGAGYLCMAIEACKEAAKSIQTPVEGYMLREVRMGKVLPLKEDTTYELVTTFKPRSSATRSDISDPWYEFQIHSYDVESGFVQHCSGYASIVRDNEANPVDGRRSNVEAPAMIQERVDRIHSSDVLQYDREIFYGEMQKNGFTYGPLFQGVPRIFMGDGEGLLDVEIPDLAGSMPYEYLNDLTLQPGTLDSAMQGAIAVTRDMHVGQGFVPVFFESCFVSARFPNAAGTQLQGLAYDAELMPGARNGTHSIYVFAPSSALCPLLHVRGMKTYVSELSRSDDIELRTHSLSKVEWMPHISLFDRTQLERYLDVESEHHIELSEALRLEEAAFFFIERYVKDSKESPKVDHLEKFHTWASDFISAVKHGKSSHQIYQTWLSASEEHKVQCCTTVAESGDEGRFICAVGRNLAEIANGSIDALSVMLEDEMLTKYYEGAHSTKRGNEIMERAIRLIGHQNPAMRVLEIGGGTAGTTLPLMQALSPFGEDVPYFSKYDFTDISVGFHAMAQKKLQKWQGLVEYRRLDINEDPGSQGYNEHSYDLIVAANVLHATPDLTETMKNVRKLLKPDGKLLLLEVTSQTLQVFLPFSTLPGWWLAQDQRQFGPAASPSMWDNLLKQNGFSGIDACVHDHSGEAWQAVQSFSVICSTATDLPHDQLTGHISVVAADKEQETRLQPIVDRIKSLTSATVQTKNIHEYQASNGTVICLSAADDRFFAEMTEDRFRLVKDMFLASTRILWVVRGAAPDGKFADGLFRTLRQENAGTKIVCLHMPNALDEECSNWIGAVFKYAFMDHPGSFDCDVEYAVINGMLQVSRVLPDTPLMQFIDNELDTRRQQLQKFKSQDRPLKLAMSSPGSFDTFHFTDGDFVIGNVAENTVEISVEAVGMNFKDLLIAMGEVPWQDIGIECSGIVTGLGPGTEGKGIELGQRVLHWGAGCYASHLHAPLERIAPIPENLSFEAAASIPIIFATAWMCLVEHGRLEAGETVLIHAGSGGVGQAAIMISQMIGAEIFTTVGSAEKRDFLTTTYGIPKDHIFYSRDTTFASAVMKATKGKGVDVLLNSLSGDGLRQSWACMATLGRFLEIGKRDALANGHIEMTNFDRSISYIAVDLGLIILRKPAYVKRVMEKLLDLMTSDRLRPVQPITRVSMDKLEQGLRMMQQGKHMGKIIVTADANMQVKATLPPNTGRLFRADGSYCITGGTGGLGLSAARWMIENGARNLILLSRSGAKASEAKAMVEDSAMKGAKVEICACDVTRREVMEAVLQKCLQTMPPIRGVVHGSLVLNDAFFENSTLEDWDRIVRTRVEGAWNLHNLINTPLDFFICLSSGAGVAGNRGQTTYAGTCSFLDAFCQWRVSQGLPACSLDLPHMSGFGYLVHHQDQAKLLAQSFGQGLDEKGFLALMKAAVLGRISAAAGNDSQTLVGNWHHPNAVELPFANDLRFSYCKRIALGAGATAVVGDEEQMSQKQALQSTTTRESAHEVAYAAVCGKIVSMMMIPLEDVNPKKPLSAYGLDSLVAVEFRNWLIKELGANLSMLELLSSRPLLQLVETILDKSKYVSDAVKTSVAVVEGSIQT